MAVGFYPRFAVSPAGCRRPRQEESTNSRRSDDDPTTTADALFGIYRGMSNEVLGQLMTTKHDDRPCTVPEDFLRLPGLFRRWELEQVFEGSDEFYISAAGETEEGTELFSVYYKERRLVPPAPGGAR
jgi:hypothetical protein